MITSIDELKQAASLANNHFFDPETLRWFGSRIGTTVYGGRYFVTSERDPHGNAWDGQRRYTVRMFEANEYTRDRDGRRCVRIDIDNVGGFGQYETAAEARAAAAKLAKELND